MPGARDTLSGDEEPEDRLACAATPGIVETLTYVQTIREIPSPKCLRPVDHQTTNGVNWSVTRCHHQSATEAEAANWCLLQQTTADCSAVFAAAEVDGAVAGVDAIGAEPWSVPILRRSRTHL